MSWSWAVPLVAGLCGSVGGPMEPTFDVPKPRPSAVLGPVAIALPPNPSVPDDPEPDSNTEDGEEVAERSAEALRETYIALARLKADGAIEAVDASRPKALLDRALRYYKRGVSAFEEEPREALAYAQAAQALTEAIEAARVAQALDRPDPDLPPPPGARSFVLRTRMIEADAEKSGPPMPAVRRDLRVQVDLRPELELDAKLLEGVNRQNFEKLKAKLEARRAEMEARLRAQRKERAEREADRKSEGVQVIYGLDESGPLAVKLQAALDNTRQRIEAIKVKAPEGGQGVFYLDAASDLIEAARRDATSGRVERAQELARAAGSLSQVPRALSGVASLRFDHPKTFAIRAGKPGEFTFEREYRVEFEADDTKDGKPRVAQRGLIFQGKPVHILIDPQENEEHFKFGTLKLEGLERMVEDVLIETELPQRVEVTLPDGDVKPGAGRLLFAPEAGRVLFAPRADDPKNEDNDDAEAEEPVVGIGVTLARENGAYRVIGLMEGGPAAKDGRVQPDDELVGVELEDERIAFEDKPIAEVVELVRGPAGSKIRLIIKSKNDDESRVVELERQPLELSREQRAQVRIFRSRPDQPSTDEDSDEEHRGEFAVEEREIILRRAEPEALRREAQKAIAEALEEIDAEAIADQISVSIEEALRDLDRETIAEKVREAIEEAREQLREQLEEALEGIEIPKDARRLQIIPVPEMRERFRERAERLQEEAEERVQRLQEEAEERAERLKEEREERTETEDVRERFERLKKEIEERTETEMLRERIERLKETIEEQAQPEALQERIEQLRRQVEALREQFERHRNELEEHRPGLKEQAEELEERAERLRDQLQERVESFRGAGIKYRVKIFTDDDGKRRQEIVVEREEQQQDEADESKDEPDSRKKETDENEEDKTD